MTEPIGMRRLSVRLSPSELHAGFSASGALSPAIAPNIGQSSDAATAALTCWQVDLDDTALDGIAELLAEDECQRAARFVRPVLTQRYRRAHAALRWLLGRHCGVDGRTLCFVTNQYGKPSLASVDALGSRLGRALPPFFSLSHSEAYALVAICDAAPVGVDIEVLRDIDDLDSFALSQLSEREQAQWRALPAAERSSAFLCGWTRKEAALKALGVGLSLASAAQIDVGLAPLGSAAALGYEGWHLPWLGPLRCRGPVVASVAIAYPSSRH